MNARSQTVLKPSMAASTASVPAHSGLLQRKCACGGTPGPTGECAGCRRNRLLGGPLQTKLRVGQLDDQYEREADRIADQVMRMPEPGLQRQVEEEELLQTKPLVQRWSPVGEVGSEAPPIVHEVLRSPGRPLVPSTRQFMESRFGHDFSWVRIYTDGIAAESARAVNARAYTVGHNVVFGSGEYQWQTTEGQHLLAHELAHVVQQSNGVTLRGKLTIRPNGDVYEREADWITNQVVAGAGPQKGKFTIRPLGVKGVKGVQRYSFGGGTGPDFGGSDRLVPVPDGHRSRVEAALSLVSRVVNNPRDFPACPSFFENNCPGGSQNALYDAFNRAVIWFNEGAPAGRGGVTAGLGGQDIGYTNLTYRIGRWAMAASFIHELMHVCGQADHHIGDRAKDACGRLPDIINISPRIEISNPI